MNVEPELLYCKVCSDFMPEQDLVSHIEEIHVGPGEELKVECGECQFKVSKTRLQLMVNHCIKTRHDLSSVHYDWKGEEQRLQEILKFNYGMKTGEGNRASPLGSPRRGGVTRQTVVVSAARKQVHHQLSKSGSRKSADSSLRARSTGASFIQRDSSYSEPVRKKKKKRGARESSPDSRDSSEPHSVSDGEGNGGEEGEAVKLEDVFAEGYEQSSYADASQDETGKEDEEEDVPDPDEPSNKAKGETSKRKKNSKKPLPMIKCQHCGNGLKPHGNIDMVKHVLTHQPENYPFYCNSCDHRAATKYNIRKHCKDKHGSGDDSTHTLSLPEGTEQKMREFIKKCLPGIDDWDHRLKNGIPGVTSTKSSSKFAL